MVVKPSGLFLASIALLVLFGTDQSRGFSVSKTASIHANRGAGIITIASRASSAAPFRLYYKDEALPDFESDGSTVVVETKQHFKKKASIVDLSTLEEIRSFIEEDDRLAVIMFYAPFCKSCQKLKVHFEKLAVDMADGIVARKKVHGKIRCARVEFNPQTKYLIMHQLRVGKVPTMQLYHRINKVWDVCGQNDAKELRRTLAELEEMSPDGLLKYAEALDDGIFLHALEEDLYDNSPEFLNEEW
jgi:thiol-disulfide isomerase/thioredoxin